MERRTLDIMLTNKEGIEGEVLCVVEEEVLEQLMETSRERDKLAKRSEKLNMKKSQTMRYARKLINQFGNSRQMKYDERTHAIGIYEGETIYLGSKERLQSDPTVAPIEGDIVRGKLTKSEKRLYQDSLTGYANLTKQIDEYIADLTNSEMKLIQFQQSVLKDREYNVKIDYLTVSLVDGKIYLCKKEEQDEEETSAEEINVETEQVGVEDGRN